MPLANVLQSFWPFRGPPDSRTEREIEDDLDAEFAFHLEQAQRDLMHEGHDRDAASDLAHARFGNVDRIKRECRRIALKERTMLQRVNFIMMIVVLLMVVAVGVQVLITQRYNTLALQAITAEITHMKYDALAAQRESNGAAPATTDDPSAPRVLVAGDIDRPAWYPIPKERVMLIHELLDQVGVDDDQWVRYQRSATGASNQSVPASEFRTGMVQNAFLRPGAELHVRNDVDPGTRQSYFMRYKLQDKQTTTWFVVASNSSINSPSWVLELTWDRNHLGGRIHSTQTDDEFILSLITGNALISAGVPGAEQLRGSWDYIDDRLVLDFSEAATLPPDGKAYGDPILIPNELRQGSLYFIRSSDAEAETLNAADAQPGGVVYVGGDVARPGTYVLPQQGTLTLRRALTAAGGVPDNRDADVTVTAIGPDGASAVKFRLKSIKADDSDYILSPDDHVQVERVWPEQPEQTPLPQVGQWVQVDENGNQLNDCTLEVIPPTDLRYRRIIHIAGDKPIGLLHCGTSTQHLGFYRSLELAIYEYPPNSDARSGPPLQRTGRWTWDGDDLLLNISSAASTKPEPLRFRFVATE